MLRSDHEPYLDHAGEEFTSCQREDLVVVLERLMHNQKCAS